MAAETEFERKKERHASGQSTVSTDSVSNYIPTPPDGGYGWVVVMAAFFIHVIVDGVTFTFGVFYTPFLEYFQEGKGKTSLVGSLLGGFYLTICFVASALVNKFGCRPVSIAGSLLSFFAFLSSRFAPSVNVLMLTYGVLGGSGFALTFFPSVIAVSFYFQKRRAIATGIAVCGAGVGGMVMAPFGRFLLDVYDWKNAMLIVAGISLNSCVFASLLRPLEPPKRRRRPRKKNVFDRLAERTTNRIRKESECNVCAHGTAAASDLMLRVQEVKNARQQMLRDEDSEFEFGSSVPNSTLNSARRLDRSDSCASSGYAPARSLSIQISRQEALRREATYMGGSPSSIGTSPPCYGTSAPAAYITVGSSSPASGNVPAIVVSGDADVDRQSEADDDAGRALAPYVDDHFDDIDRRRSSNFKTVPEEDENEEQLLVGGKCPDPDDDKDAALGESPPNGYKKVHNLALERVKQAAEKMALNGSLPNGIPFADRMGSTNLAAAADADDDDGDGNVLVANRRRHHSKSAGDINTIQRGSGRSKAAAGRHRPRGVQKIDYSRPLYRKDIFYSGSLLNVTHFRSQPDVKTYVKSMMSIPEAVPPEDESCLCRWLPKSAKDTIREMMDVSLFKEPIFLVATIGNLFAFIGLFIPFVFIADRALLLGIPVNKAAFLLSVIGITNMLGRLIAGVLANIKGVSSLLLHNLALLVAGIACVLNMFSDTYVQMCIFAAVFGLCVATYISLTSIVLCNMLGLERLTNAYGLLCALRGIASVAGPPIAGLVFDKTGNYNTSFHVGGVMLFLSGLVFSSLHLPFFQRQSWQNIQQDAGCIEVVFDDDVAAAYKSPDVTVFDSTENGQPLAVTNENSENTANPEVV